MVIFLYVADMLIIGTNEHAISLLNFDLDKTFTIKNLSLACFLLGIEICRIDLDMLLNQRKFIVDILRDVRLSTCKPVSLPLPLVPFC